MEDVLTRIQRLTKERFNLYLEAGHHRLSPDQLARLEWLNNNLPLVWDEHRREVAAARWAGEAQRQREQRAA